MSLTPLFRKVVTLASLVADTVSSIAEPSGSVLDGLLPPVGHTVASFGESLAFSGPSRSRTAGSFLSAVNDGTLATKITITRQVEETAKLLIGWPSTARSLLAGAS